MKTWITTAALAIAALAAAVAPVRAEGVPQLLSSDPLSREILAKTARENGGVTAVVRVASGQVVELKLGGVSSSTATLAPAADPANLALKTAADLAAKPAKPAKRKPVKKAVDQLKRAAAPAGSNWAR